MQTPERTPIQLPELTRGQLFARLKSNRAERAALADQLEAEREAMMELLERGKPIATVKEMVEAAGIDRSYYYELEKKRARRLSP